MVGDKNYGNRGRVEVYIVELIELGSGRERERERERDRERER